MLHTLSQYLPLSTVDLGVLCFFLVAWIGYGRFAKAMAVHRDTLSSTMRVHREDWLYHMLSHENRIQDVALLGNLERVVTFFASTTLLIIAGILTALSTTEGAISMLSSVPGSIPISPAHLQLKFLVLALVFVYAFFKFTWSMRQYNFCSVLVGSAPSKKQQQINDATLKLFSSRAAKLVDLASHDFNSGLRAYYFSMALLVWLVHPWAFMLATIWIVFILYRREFHSQALKTLRQSLEYKSQLTQGNADRGSNE